MDFTTGSSVNIPVEVSVSKENSLSFTSQLTQSCLHIEFEADLLDTASKEEVVEDCGGLCLSGVVVVRWRKPALVKL